MTTRHPDAPSCGTSIDVLSRYYDGEPVDPALERHIRSCPACEAVLHDMGSTATAVAGMSGVPHVQARIDATATRQSRHEMADFVHELALACLAAHGEALASLHLMHDPRPFAHVAADIRSLHRRLLQMGTTLDIGGLPPAEPRPEQALLAARACLTVLASLEGPSERQRRALSASQSPRAGSQS